MSGGPGQPPAGAHELCYQALEVLTPVDVVHDLAVVSANQARHGPLPERFWKDVCYCTKSCKFKWDSMICRSCYSTMSEFVVLESPRTVVRTPGQRADIPRPPASTP